MLTWSSPPFSCHRPGCSPTSRTQRSCFRRGAESATVTACVWLLLWLGKYAKVSQAVVPLCFSFHSPPLSSAFPEWKVAWLRQLRRSRRAVHRGWRSRRWAASLVERRWGCRPSLGSTTFDRFLLIVAQWKTWLTFYLCFSLPSSSVPRRPGSTTSSPRTGWRRSGPSG